MNIILGSVASSIFDIDALRYIQAVEIADNQVLEGSVKTAINTLVVGLKTDGIWSEISCCGILASARTLNGALVPLKGVAPTNFNFVAGDYSRSLGLSGDGLTKYIDTNEPTNSRPLTSSHISIYMSKQALSDSGGSSNRYIVGTMVSLSSNDFFACNSNSLTLSSTIIAGIRRGVLGSFNILNANNVGFKGGSRSSSNFTIFRTNNTETTSDTVFTGNLRPESQYLFATRATPSGNVISLTNAGLTFYSIGSAINLERLDNRVTTFMQTLSTLV